MSESSDKARKAAGAGREERLAAALRENLRRRKAQARARREMDTSAGDQGERSGTHPDRARRGDGS